MYEALLVENNIKYEPLHGAPRQPASQQPTPRSQSPVSSNVKNEVYQPKNFWHAMKQAVRDEDSESDFSGDEAHEPAIQDALRRGFQFNNDHLLLGSSSGMTDLSTLHPSPIQIFRLWQMYLENVDPLFKVTHSITLQSRIIEAASNLASISPSLEALVFAIYCIAVNSLSPDDCRAAFGSSKDDLLSSYRFGCQQALTNARFLQTRDRDCLTALFLYLVSIGRKMHPQSICSLCGVAMRIAQHMGIHTEAALARCTPFEAEMRRRLWWALVVFDRRIAEVSGSMSVTYLVPAWDCKIPLNVNDSELRPEMNELPASACTATEAVFAVSRAEFGDFIRHTGFQLDFTCPWLKPLARDQQHSHTPDGFVMPALETILEDKYLQFCDTKNPLHYMTIWMTRAQIATAHLIEYFSKYQDPETPRPTEEQRSAAVSLALRTLVCNTRIMTSPLSKRFRWLVQFYFPFPHYFQIVRELKRKPLGEQADRAWAVMAENYEALFESFGMSTNDHPSFQVFGKLILTAWEAREAAAVEVSSEPPIPPRMIAHVKQQLGLIKGKGKETDDLETVPELGHSDVGMSATSASQAYMVGFGFQEGFQVPLFVDPDQLTWNTMNWT
ncbi:hypothetical protein OQA88_13301 [Cercophora sp. LCS_1]